MLPSKVIFDNTVFNYSLRIKSVDLLRISQNLFSEKILVPAQVYVELSSIKDDVIGLDLLKLEKIKERITNNSFYKYCTDFDIFVYDELRKKIDAGEADAVAQSLKTGVRHFISDDSKACDGFIKEKYPNIITLSTFYIIALADIQGLLPDYEKTFAEYHSVIQYEKFNPKTRKRHKQKLRFEYANALKTFDLANDKKRISLKTSVDTIMKKYSTFQWGSSSTPISLQFH